MNPLTYLGFTIFSIIMQFCVMEFIHERFQFDKDSSSFNESIHKKNVIKDINRKPHALFYQKETDKITFETYNDADSTKYINTSLEDITILTSTDISSTSFEVYYENTSIIEDFFTTESYSTNSEIDNVTEITFLDTTTTAKPNASKAVTKKESCFCNLLYQKCDINCCCDADCNEDERSLFINCIGDECGKATKEGKYFCNSYPTCRNTFSTDVFNDLFCVVKVNLPDKRIRSKFQLDVAVLNATYKWEDIKKSDFRRHFKKKQYEYGDPIWLFQNGTISTLHLPTTMTNYYCNGKKQMIFLTNERIECNVKLKDLYMFSALKTLDGTKLISVTELSQNTTALNCSTLHCANWTVLACNENICIDYNTTIHAPICTDDYCNNLAHTLEYIFYYLESKITNASLKLHLTTIPMSVTLLTQKITVQWYLGNESIDDIIQLSGNPGYIPGLPVIFSSATNNHTTNFYNKTYGKSILSFPQNVNGQCNWTSKNKSLLFGLNTRSKCRFNTRQNIYLKNATRTCQAIQSNIKERLRLNQMLYISPYGNPRDVTDEQWIKLELHDRTFLYGEYRSDSKLVCYNLVTRYAFVIAYADMSGGVDKEKNKIIKSSVDGTQFNYTFDLAELSIVLTIDIRFVDISAPIVEFAKAPHLNIHFPANFFFDYPSNVCHQLTPGYIELYCFILLLMMK